MSIPTTTTTPLPDDHRVPTSSLRSAAHAYARARARAHDDPLSLLASTASTVPRLDPALVNYAVSHQSHRELSPGILADGRITANHPLVHNYLASVRRVPNDREVTPGDDPFGWKPRRREDRAVYEVLGYEKPFTARESDCIFVLAALKVYYNPRHRAHFTFWGKSSGEATAEKVQKILDLTPCPIASPMGWMHKDENMWLLEVLQYNAFPPTQTRRRAGGMALRDRRAGAGAGNENTTAPANSSRPKRARTNHNKPAADVAATPLRQSARLAMTTPQSKAVPLPDADEDAEDDVLPTLNSKDSDDAKIETLVSSVVPILSELPALNALLTPSIPSSSLTPSPASDAEIPLPAEGTAPPAPARRSTRVPKKRQIFSPQMTSSRGSASPESNTKLLGHTDGDADTDKHSVTRPNALGLRARSSSSAQSYESSATAVSTSSSHETAVEMDVEPVASPSKKRKRAVVEEEDADDDVKDAEDPQLDDAGEPDIEEEDVPVQAKKGSRSRRSSGARRPAAKRVRKVKA